MVSGDASGGSLEIDRLFDELYDELRAVARRAMRSERRDHTLQPTDLVGEAFLKLSRLHSIDFTNERQFLGVAAAEMRRILTDHARRKASRKRGGGAVRVTLQHLATFRGREIDLLDLDKAIHELGDAEPRHSRVAELRLFAGLTAKETAELLGISVRTAHRDWSFVRSYLSRALGRERAEA